MNRYMYQQNAFASCEEMVGSITISDRKDPVVCPKPRRLGRSNHFINDLPIRPRRWQLSHQSEICDSRAGAELLDLILSKGGYGAEQSPTHVASSPPFFSGSPPSRAANPLIQDARFGDERLTTPMSPLTISTTPSSGMSPSPSSSSRKVGCARSNKYGHKPAAIRIEGFDCLDRDRRNCSIPAMA